MHRTASLCRWSDIARFPHGGGTVKGNFLSYNDSHGAIDPPGGSGATVNGTPAGGVNISPPG